MYFAYMDHFIPIFWLYGLLFYGLFAYMDQFSRDKRVPYIRNWVYFGENKAHVNVTSLLLKSYRAFTVVNLRPMRQTRGAPSVQFLVF